MSHDPYQRPQAAAVSGAREVDVGLQQYMRNVFNTMCYGLGLTGLAAYGVANVEPLYNAIFGTWLYWVAMFAPLALLWAGLTPRRVERMSPEKLRMFFYGFSLLMGLSMASIFVVFSGASIARAFFITAATFAGMSLYGYTTKRDLTGMGSFMMMGLMGIFIAMLVNIFLESQMVHFVVSIMGVIIFTGLTAFEVQLLKETYIHNRHSEDATAKMGVMGALNLYLSFINLFQFILHLVGNRE